MNIILFYDTIYLLVNLSELFSERGEFFNMLKPLIKNMRPKNFSNLAIKSTFLFSSLFIILLIIFSTALMIIFSYRTDSTITESNTWALEQMATFTDKYLFEKIDYLCDTYFNTNSENENMRAFFTEMENMTPNDMQEMQKELSIIKQQNSFLDNIILYNGKFDSLVSTDDGIVYGAKDIRNHLSVQNRFFSYLDGITTDFYVPQDDNVMIENQKDSILYVHYVSSSETSSFGKRNVNCVIMAVDIENINAFIDDVDAHDVQCFAIMNKDSKVLIHSENFPGMNSIKNNNSSSYNKIINSAFGSSKMKFQNSTATYIWLQSKIKDWKYIYIVSTREWYEQLLFIIFCISSTTLLILILLYFLMAILSKKIYKPFNDVVDKAKMRLANEENTDNEIEFLNNIIDDFSQKKVALDSLNEKYSVLLLHQTATKIINGFTNATPEYMIDQLAHLGIDFSYKWYSLIIIEFNEEILKTFSYEQSNFILYDVMDVLYETFNCIVVLSSTTTIDLVINENEINYDTVIKTIKQLIIEKSLINLYICDKTDNVAQISRLREQADGLTKYSYIYGFDNTFFVNELLERELDDSEVDQKQINYIENLFRSINQTRFYDECNKLLADVKHNKHSFAYAQNVIFKIHGIICNIAKEFGIPITQDDAFKKVMDNKFFDDLTVYLFELSDKIFDAISIKKASMEEDRRSNLISDIKEYISKHITEDISLASVAQKFNISAGYLSKFFKENTSEAFSKYVIEQKFNYAAHSLTETPNRSITEIANELGYFDSAYFSRQFKAHYGVTPVQYRKINH